MWAAAGCHIHPVILRSTCCLAIPRERMPHPHRQLECRAAARHTRCSASSPPALQPHRDSYYPGARWCEPNDLHLSCGSADLVRCTALWPHGPACIRATRHCLAAIQDRLETNALFRRRSCSQTARDMNSPRNHLASRLCVEGP
eukprot:6201590-Pleurochrysis_carterae.AAC.3